MVQKFRNAVILDSQNNVGLPQWAIEHLIKLVHSGLSFHTLGFLLFLFFIYHAIHILNLRLTIHCSIDDHQYDNTVTSVRRLAWCSSREHGTPSAQRLTNRVSP